MRFTFGFRKATALALVATMLASIAAPGFVQAGNATDDLKQIEYTYYFRGKYQQAIEALQTFLARVDLTDADATRAQEFMAASYVLGGAPAMGKDVFLQLLAKSPTYAGPDPTVFKLEVMNVFGEARSEYASMALKNGSPNLDAAQGSVPGELSTEPAEKKGKPIYKKWWLYAGTAALLIAVGAAAGGGSDSPGGGAASGSVTVGVTVR